MRPWLQDFTASYLKNHIDYGDEQVRAQIQAVYDAGYDEWLLWDAGVSYHYGGLRTPEEAAREDERIKESRAAEERAAKESQVAAEMTSEAGSGDEGAAGVEAGAKNATEVGAGGQP